MKTQHNHKLYLEHFQLRQNPFRQEPDPDIFYPGAGRSHALDRLLEDITGGEPLMHLTGGDGVGKTLLSLLLARRLQADIFDVVSLDHPVGSFEDLLRIICHVLRGKAGAPGAAGQSHLPEFKKLLREREEKNRKVLLILDEAEKLFLATLERLVRLICDTDAADVLQILLIGRPDLGKNVEQLVIYCSGVDINAGYVLEPLTRSETAEYLRYRLKKAGTPGDKHRAIFTEDAVTAIYQEAMGNVSLTNMLAEKGLKLACESGMFKVEGTLLQPQQMTEGRSLEGLLTYLNRLPLSVKWLFPLAVLVLVLCLVFSWPEKRQVKTVQDAGTPVLAKGPGVKKGGDTSAVPEKIPSRDAVTVSPPVNPSQDAGNRDVESLAYQGTQKQPPPVSTTSDQEQALVIRPIAKKKRSLPAQSTGEIESHAPGRDRDLIFEERLRATSNWLAWSYRDGYTIQLMVLASETAEDNLKDLLVSDDYYNIRENLYILRKVSSPVLLVFYGLYDTMEDARRARDELPEFLRSHEPYALSIDEALKKSEQ